MLKLNTQKIINDVENNFIKNDLPLLRIGDNVRIGVKIVEGRDELGEAARGLLHERLVTYQTDEKGQPINELLIEEVGCPVIDVEGNVCGIAIASRGRNETQRGPSSILPNHIVNRVIERLLADAKSK